VNILVAGHAAFFEVHPIGQRRCNGLVYNEDLPLDSKGIIGIIPNR
jgi:hypothetical protein